MVHPHVLHRLIHNIGFIREKAQQALAASNANREALEPHNDPQPAQWESLGVVGPCGWNRPPPATYGRPLAHRDPRLVAISDTRLRGFRPWTSSVSCHPAWLRTVRSADGQSALSDTVVLDAHDRNFVKEVFKTWDNTIEDSIHLLDAGRREPQ
jgi:hypothetical protein